jgi:hypothetical protein
MKVRQIDVSDADCRSAEIFFRAVTSYWDLSKSHALDMFARNGALTVTNYIDHVRSLDLWELNPEHEHDLIDWMPDEIKIGCSYKHLEECDKQYDFIVIDTPQGIHNDWQGVPHTEHFDVLCKLPKIMADRCIVVVYVNMAPYDKNVEGSQGYDEYEEYDFQKWMEIRADFYENEGLVTEAVAISTYELLFEKHLFVMKNMLLVPCFSDVPGKEPYAFRLAMEFERTF